MFWLFLYQRHRLLLSSSLSSSIHGFYLMIRWLAALPGSFLKMSSFPPHLHTAESVNLRVTFLWLQAPQVILMGWEPRVILFIHCSQPLSSHGSLSRQFLYIYLPFKSQAARFQVQGTLSLHLITPYPPCGGPQSLRQTLALSESWSLLSGAETVHMLCFCSCSHFCL